ncbi:MAG: efflux RND transporter periplasmic adaptor subunit [Pontiella sp.]
MNLFKKFILPLLLILMALGIGQIIIITTKKPEKRPPQRTAYAVDVTVLQAGQQTVQLQVTGTVTPAIHITLRSRVAGEILEVAPEFIDGGSFKQGEMMLKIDPFDYELAIEQKKAELAEAAYQLQLEKGQSDIAAREWELLGYDEDASESDRELALRIPHLKYRTAKLAAAQAELENARLDLARTEVCAPFNCVIIERETDLGTLTALQDTLASVAGSDQYYVRASIPMKHLKWITCDPENGSIATITRSIGDVRQGHVVRLESALEESGRMARIIIAIDHPTTGAHPMLLNEYVRISIEGNSIENAYHIPRAALHDDHLVWLANSENLLEVREVQVIWRDATDVILSAGVKEGDRLILTNLATPINGLKLRIEGESIPTSQKQEPNAGQDHAEKGMKSDEK